MQSPFEVVITKMRELGMLQFLFPFFLTAAVFYGLLRKSKLFGEPERNVVVNGVVALVAAFMVWSFPILAGIDIETQLSTFMFQSTVAILTMVVGLLVVSLFFPEFPKVGPRAMYAILVLGILIGIGIFFASGISQIVIPGFKIAEIPTDTITGIIFIIAVVASIAFIAR
jgi:hypothetical protein